MQRTYVSLIAALALTPATAHAQSEDPAPEPEPVAAEPVAVTTAEPVADVEAWADPVNEDVDTLQIHGWVSQGAMVSSGNNYLTSSKRGSFEFFETGINVTKELGTDTRAGVQIFAQDLGPIGNYDPIIDWAYVDHRIKPWFGVRAGHFKMPLYLHSERMDADMSRTAVLMPQAVYDQHFRDVLAAVSGLDAYGTVELGGAGSIDYDAYVGTVFITPHIGEYDFDHVLGTRVVWNTPVSCLRVAAHGLYANFRESYEMSAEEIAAIQMSGAAPPGWDGRMVVDYNDWSMTGGAVECTTEKLTLTAEASLWKTELTFSPMIQAAVPYEEVRAYAQAEYRATDELSVSLYTSVHLDRTGDGKASGDGEHQVDTAASIRYDVTPNLLVKAEAHAIDGYSLTESALNTDDEERAHRWGMFLAKTTLTF
jgi:hypothetical protein